MIEFYPGLGSTRVIDRVSIFNPFFIFYSTRLVQASDWSSFGLTYYVNPSFITRLFSLQLQRLFVLFLNKNCSY